MSRIRLWTAFRVPSPAIGDGALIRRRTCPVVTPRASRARHALQPPTHATHSSHADRCTRGVRLVLIATLCALGPSIATAQTRQHDAQHAKRIGEIRVASLKFEGVYVIGESDLRAALATKASSRWPWGDQYEFNDEDFQADLKRVVAFYADHGYPRARVVSAKPVFNDKKTEVSIVIQVEEGEPIRLASIDFFGFEAVPERSVNFFKGRLPVSPGQVRQRPNIQSAVDLAVNLLREYGFPYARVQPLEGPGPTPNTVTLTLAAEPGNLAKFGPITIAGNKSVGEDVVRRQLAFGPGDTFKMSRVLESQRRLYSLELFQFANFEVPDLAAQPTEIPVKTTLVEGKHRRVQFGGGYGSEEHARAQINWRHVNFFGGARTIGIESKWSSLDRGVRVNFTEPYFFSPSYKFSLAASVWYANEPAFTLTTSGGRMSVSREVVRRDFARGRVGHTRGTVSFINEYEHYEIANYALLDLTLRDELIALGLDPRTGTGGGYLRGLAFDLSHDTIPNLLDARRGYLATVHLEQAGSWLPSDFTYNEATLEGRQYQPVGGSTVLATRVHAGALFGPGDPDSHIPFFKRYFLGGATNVRGWGRFEVGPTSGAGLPIGGFSVFDFSTELRFPIKGNFSGVAFLDGGNVWSGKFDYHLNDLRYDVGPGLRYSTPIGPVRVDIGYQLTPLDLLIVDGSPEKHHWRIHFSIGQAF
jgi:outer membrane protein assembly complex protein YaeT